MDKLKCNECDERGYIQDTKYSSHSCKCGWAIEPSMKKFENVNIMDLLAYGRNRVIEKQNL